MQHSEFKNLHRIKTTMHLTSGLEYEIAIFRELITDENYGDFKLFISREGNKVGNPYHVAAETMFDAVKLTSTQQEDLIGEMLDIIKDDIDRNLEGQFR